MNVDMPVVLLTVLGGKSVDLENNLICCNPNVLKLFGEINTIITEF